MPDFAYLGNSDAFVLCRKLLKLFIDDLDFNFYMVKIQFVIILGVFEARIVSNPKLVEIYICRHKIFIQTKQCWAIHVW